ncbi:copper resistance protein CopD [Bergeyella cardium]|uniref:Copper resistance protein CopD n=1 Tax=Bergeyella cardium TaxID=1585976 RepID=A0A6P1QVB8_9FLAO|nr:copper resistance protein CopD [Bergeyella cardium]QHN64750.1 copper resistance protein CopD [Bergeyella cardium]WHE34052.1 copper resistance protein CopD [Bergeyella cardium]WHF60703.1 copper resistance protein CopD [Bergeyella cardium]
MHHLLLIIHLIAATIWVGGHLVLAIGYMPRALKYKDFSYIGNFEKKYEPIGMPSLLLLVITGISMAYDYDAGLKSWFSFSNSIETVVSLKLSCLLLSVCFAISAQTRVLPKLRKGNLSKLPEMAVHITSVTLLGVTMVILGSFVRYGGISF